MKKSIKLLILGFFALIFSISNVNYAKADSEKFYLGGFAAGFSLYTEGAEIVGVCDVITSEGIKSPAKEIGIMVGDIILAIGDTVTDNAENVAKAIKDGNKKKIKIRRNGEVVNNEITPAKDMNGSFKLGVFIKDDINGIGTVTFIKGNKFGALGHPVVTSDGNLMKIKGGKLFKCDITGAVKGERGRAGELKGIFVGSSCGTIDKNNFTGVFGELDKPFSELKEISIGDGVVGDASVFSTINSNGLKEYKISIVKVDNDNGSNKNFVIKVKDKDLISQTGGIVQGMSGSPIVQNGKLVGAVTHVFINDPTRGFAISINKMLENA